MKWIKRGILYTFFSILTLILSLLYTGNCLNYYQEIPSTENNRFVIPFHAMVWVTEERPCKGYAEWVEYIKLTENQAKDKQYDGYFIVTCDDNTKHRLTFTY